MTILVAPVSVLTFMVVLWDTCCRVKKSGALYHVCCLGFRYRLGLSLSMSTYTGVSGAHYSHDGLAPRK